MDRKITSALVSVYNKENLEAPVRMLHQLGVVFYSTGGTREYLEQLGIPVIPVETLTSYPSILGGRVKTLHPKIFGGILGRRDKAGDVAEMKTHDIPEIDLVIVDLYPFEDTVRQGAEEAEIIEKIDIGGVSLIRAAAKNHKDTLIVASRKEYAPLLSLLEEKKGTSSLSDRKSFAVRAFSVTAHYDTQIYRWMNRKEECIDWRMSEEPARVLRYGENPHQRGYFYGPLQDMLEIIQGKELSYNNLADADAALRLVQEFDAPAAAIIKHTNACGLAVRAELSEAYEAAFACDTTSAFGGVIALNRPVDLATAEKMNSLFFELLAAPGYTEEALAILQQKKNRILLVWKKPLSGKEKMVKSVLNGILVQDWDNTAESREQFRQVSKRPVSEGETSDLEFAIKAVKHLKSNGIALVRNGQLIGMGCGQTSRIDALEQAIRKAGSFGFDVRGAVMASDAFFPFPDCVQIAAAAGITAIAQPGGSIKDQDSVDAADKLGVSMVMTGVRHFRHG